MQGCFYCLVPLTGFGVLLLWTTTTTAPLVAVLFATSPWKLLLQQVLDTDSLGREGQHLGQFSFQLIESRHVQGRLAGLVRLSYGLDQAQNTKYDGRHPCAGVVVVGTTRTRTTRCVVQGGAEPLHHRPARCGMRRVTVGGSRVGGR